MSVDGQDLLYVFGSHKHTQGIKIMRQNRTEEGCQNEDVNKHGCLLPDNIVSGRVISLVQIPLLLSLIHI